MGPIPRLLFAWHVHHDVLVEPLLETIEERAQYIRNHKPAGEQEVRLRLLRLVRGSLPPGVVETWRALVEARCAYAEAQRAYVEAGRAATGAWCTHDKALGEYRDAITTLHAQECPGCPWDGTTIFPDIRNY